MERNIGRPPVWQFPDLPSATDLAFERLDFDNRDVVLEMFESDTNPFVSADFKSAGKLYEYVAAQWICSPYSGKRGAADWIIRTSQERAAGLLHVYEVAPVVRTAFPLG